jgi:hypothetical protein
VQAQQQEKLPMVSRVYMICNAYEHGVGRGMKRRAEDNPFVPGGEEAEAYRIGWEFGMERSDGFDTTKAADPAASSDKA